MWYMLENQVEYLKNILDPLTQELLSLSDIDIGGGPIAAKKFNF